MKNKNKHLMTNPIQNIKQTKIQIAEIRRVKK